MKTVYIEKLKHLFYLWDKNGVSERYKCFTDKNAKYAIYGAGAWGLRIKDILKEQYGTLPIAFIDQSAENNPYIADGINVYSPKEFYRVAGDVPVGVSVRAYLTGEITEEVNRTLKNAGFTDVVNIGTADAYCSDDFIYMNKIDRGKACSVINLLSDTVSMEQYYTYIYSRIMKTPFFAQTYPATTSYCATELFTLGKNDHLLDCGAYDGSSTKYIIENFPELKHITMFEPDEESYAAIRDISLRYPKKSIQVMNKAVGNINGEIGFASLHTVSSRIDESSQNRVECCRIDDIELEVPPTFIKMDVEGAEPDALNGASNTITSHRPILAICVYHKISHIFDIPLFIYNLQPDYKLFFRKYSGMYGSYDFVLYAVPPERLL